MAFCYLTPGSLSGTHSSGMGKEVNCVTAAAGLSCAASFKGMATNYWIGPNETVKTGCGELSPPPLFYFDLL